MLISDPIPEYEITAPTEAIIKWRHDPVSYQVLEIVKTEIQSSLVRIGNGETIGDAIIRDTARAVGYVEGLRFLEAILELRDVVEKKEDVDDGEENSPAVR